MSRRTSLLSQILRLNSAFRAPRSALASRRLFLETLEGRNLLATFTVVNTDDSGPGSLRQAMLDAGGGTDHAEHHTIEFNIPGLPGTVHTIQPLTPLPWISNATIDATTQSGYDALGLHPIELNGELTIPTPGPGIEGLGVLDVRNDVSVRGLTINRYVNGTSVGIWLSGANNDIEGNYIGLDPEGLTATVPQMLRGINFGAGPNVIGGTTAAQRNVIAGSVVGDIYMQFGGHDNRIIGNFVGTDRGGITYVGGGSIHLDGSNAVNNHVGEPGAGNVIADRLTISGGTLNSVHGNTIGLVVLVHGAHDNFIGGGGSDEGNRISHLGLYNGSVANKVQGNTIGSIEILSTLGAFSGDSHHNIIGTDGNGNGDAGEGNVIHGLVSIHDPGTHHTVIAGNLIGTDSTGLASSGQNGGILIASDSSFNRIGTDGNGTSDDLERNVISGGSGINLAGHHNTVAGNFIGTNKHGTSALPNQVGVLLGGSDQVVGGTTAASRNVISGNIEHGIRFNSGGDSQILGNYIGTDATGTYAIGNSTGIGGRMWGGSITGNVVSGNFFGISIQGGVGDIQGNLIGTNGNGTTAVGNVNGVFLRFTDHPNDVLVGGADPDDRNIIAGNGVGVRIDGAGYTVQGNYIGRGLAGTDIVNQSGVYVEGGGTALVGGAMPGQGNLISGNGLGIHFNAAFGTSQFHGNEIVNNDHGVQIVDGTMNQIVGGTGPGEGNTIAFNHRGVVVGRSLAGPYGEVILPFYQYAKNNQIIGNSIFENELLGIDLSNSSGGVGDGATPNDSLDADTGSNEFQNFPTLASAYSGPASRVIGTLHSLPNTNFTLHFYANTAADPSGYGEGERYLGSGTAATDASGNASFDVSGLSAAAEGEFITATATDAAGNTSEFSIAIEAVDPVQIVGVNIQPESINVDSNGTLTVVVYGSVEFDAALIDVASVRFAEAAAWQSTLLDTNNDGLLDMQLKFRRQDTILDDIYAQLLFDDEDADGILDSTQQIAEVAITGETLAEELFSGSDDVTLFLSGRSLRELLDELFG